MDCATAKRLAETTETAPEILLAIARVIGTDDEGLVLAARESGEPGDEVIAVAQRIWRQQSRHREGGAASFDCTAKRPSASGGSY